jgi:hypothetical protein
MPKFTFICDHNDNIGDGPVITYETERLFIDDVLFDFQDFLKGCGFVFDGTVQVVEDDVDLEPTDDEVGHNVMNWTANELTKEPNANQG